MKSDDVFSLGDGLVDGAGSLIDDAVQAPFEMLGGGAKSVSDIEMSHVSDAPVKSGRSNSTAIDDTIDMVDAVSKAKGSLIKGSVGAPLIDKDVDSIDE